MAKRPERPDHEAGQTPLPPLSTRPRSFTAGVARMRLRTWGAMKPRLLQRMALYLRSLREQAGESMEEAAAAALADGETASRRTVWYLEQLTDINVARERERVNFMLVAYLAERWGSSLPEVWAYMTGEEEKSADAAADAGQRAEARALGNLYLHLRTADPERARQLLDFGRFVLSESEREAEDRASGGAGTGMGAVYDAGEDAAAREALLDQTRAAIEAATAREDEREREGENEGKRPARRSS